MGLTDFDSDYGSGISVNSTSSWRGSSSKDVWSMNSFQPRMSCDKGNQKSTSLTDLAKFETNVDKVMMEFRMNGSDSPYNPEDDQLWSRQAEYLSGMGPASAYLRQQSWPAAEPGPVPRAPRSASTWVPSLNAGEFIPRAAASTPAPKSKPKEVLTEDQLRVLNSLPNTVLYSLLKEMEQAREGEKKKKQSEECRFCKNNGERESFYGSHALRDARGRVSCPVLRAFRCTRCGASGDRAHTIKYCPYTTPDERIKSAAMMRSVRMASSGRRRSPATTAVDEFVMFGQTTPSVIQDSNYYNQREEQTPLDPLWAALEMKLLL